MKTIAKTQKAYTLSYKKKSATTDPYLPRGASRKISVCGGCRAVYMNKRWYAEGDVEEAALRNPEATKIVCPACLKIRDNRQVVDYYDLAVRNCMGTVSATV